VSIKEYTLLPYGVLKVNFQVNDSCINQHFLLPLINFGTIYIYMRVWLKEEKFCSYWQPQNKEYELLNWNFPSSHLLDSTNSIRKYLRELAYQNLVETNHNFYCYGLQNLIILKFKNIRTLVLKFNSSLILMFQHRLNSSL
jgi:hypothetical protein